MLPFLGAVPSPTPEPIPIVAPVLGPAKAGSKSVDLSSFKPKYPTKVQHTEFVVEVNGKGQVSRIRSGKRASDINFSAITYGNAMQVFIRKPNGDAISGLYKLAYDYNPKTQRVRRTVELVRAGGVNAAAPGIVDVLAERNRKGAQRAKPSPAPTTKQ